MGARAAYIYIRGEFIAKPRRSQKAVAEAYAAKSARQGCRKHGL
jgi:NADH:ubiquinone oxidoreductase subunit F (NADH-binding)